MIGNNTNKEFTLRIKIQLLGSVSDSKGASYFRVLTLTLLEWILTAPLESMEAIQDCNGVF